MLELLRAEPLRRSLRRPLRERPQATRETVLLDVGRHPEIAREEPLPFRDQVPEGAFQHRQLAGVHVVPLDTIHAVQRSFRRLPAVHRLIELPALERATDAFGRDTVMESCRRAVDDLRRRVRDGELADDEVDAACDALEHTILDDLANQARAAYPRVVNATGVVLHTNLGRAPLPDAPVPLTSYLALEFDLAAGQRGQRLAPLASRISAVFGAETAVMVNNNAAALFLMLIAHARDREVIVSRSQLIEIGGSFRLPPSSSSTSPTFGSSASRPHRHCPTSPSSATGIGCR